MLRSFPRRFVSSALLLLGASVLSLAIGGCNGDAGAPPPRASEQPTQVEAAPPTEPLAEKDPPQTPTPAKPRYYRRVVALCIGIDR
jgi:hypothetical protein